VKFEETVVISHSIEQVRTFFEDIGRPTAAEVVRARLERSAA